MNVVFTQSLEPAPANRVSAKLVVSRHNVGAHTANGMSCKVAATCMATVRGVKSVETAGP